MGAYFYKGKQYRTKEEIKEMEDEIKVDSIGLNFLVILIILCILLYILL
jgi:hypothetical protein